MSLSVSITPPTKKEELSAEITKGMEILFVESMDEVLKAAMGRKRK